MDDECSRAAPSVSAGPATGALSDFSPASASAPPPRPRGRTSRPEKSPQRLEKAKTDWKWEPPTLSSRMEGSERGRGRRARAGRRPSKEVLFPFICP